MVFSIKRVNVAYFRRMKCELARRVTVSAKSFACFFVDHRSDRSPSYEIIVPSACHGLRFTYRSRVAVRNNENNGKPIGVNANGISLVPAVFVELGTSEGAGGDGWREKQDKRVRA